MQILCEQCGSTGPAGAVEVRDGVIVATCAACGHEEVVGGGTAAAPSSVSAPEAAPVPEASPALEVVEPLPVEAGLPPVKCPKCGHRQSNEESCHKCGLVFAMAPTSNPPWERPPPGKEGAVRQAQQLWDEVMRTPGAEPPHKAFADFCRDNGIATWGAMRYRHWVADHPSHGLSRRYHDRTVADAQVIAQVLANPSGERIADGAKKVRSVLMVASGVGVVVVLYVLAKIIMGNAASPYG